MTSSLESLPRNCESELLVETTFAIPKLTELRTNGHESFESYCIIHD